MDRIQAIKIITANEIENLTSQERELIIYNHWGFDESDEGYELLPSSLKDEIIIYDEPQESTCSSIYDILVQLACESSYGDYSNEHIASMVSEILKKKVIIEGESPKKYRCPCCGKETLSVRGEYEICFNCWWEDDGNEDEEQYSGPNHMTLKEGRRNYSIYGTCDV